MAYVVLSANFVPYPEGTRLTADQLDGCDIAALVAGGHLEPVEPVEPDPSAPVSPPVTDTAAVADQTKE